MNQKEILRVPFVKNLRQFQKIINQALELGAEEIYFDADRQNPQVKFYSDFTLEELRLYEIEKLKKEFNHQINDLESISYKTHFIRVKNYICKAEVDEVINDYLKQNNLNVEDCLINRPKQIITNEYDDFEDDLRTVFINEIVKSSTKCVTL